MVIGQMVIAHGCIGRVSDISSGVATVQAITPDGTVRTSIAPVASLASLWDAMRPRAVWPEAGHLDEVIAEREEREAAAIKKAERKAREKTARKARRSNKIKRRSA